MGHGSSKLWFIIQLAWTMTMFSTVGESPASGCCSEASNFAVL